MDFSQKYHLIELLPGEGVQTYRARQTNTGRDVTVHVLVGGKNPENEAFLLRLRAMPPHSMAKLIEVGEYQGDTFVVTVAPPYQRLEEWLAEQDHLAAAEKEFGKAGFWKRPEPAGLAPPPPPPPPAKAPEPGEFTRMFQIPIAGYGTGRVYANVSESGNAAIRGDHTGHAADCARSCVRGTRRVHEDVPGADPARAGSRANPSAASGTRRVHPHVPFVDARCPAAERLAAPARQIAGTWRVHANVSGAAPRSGPPGANRRRVHAIL